MLTLVVGILTVVLVVWLVWYMRAQKVPTSAQAFLQQHRYQEAMKESERGIAANSRDSAAHLHRAEAAKLLGRFEEAITSYRTILSIDHTDAAAREGIALSLTYLGHEPDTARQLMEEAVQVHPQIQEFQALALAFILLRQGRREEALRLYEDNVILLETRFRDDYTDPDPLLAETLFLYAELARASGDTTRAANLLAKVKAWAPGSIFAAWASR